MAANNGFHRSGTFRRVLHSLCQIAVVFEHGTRFHGWFARMYSWNLLSRCKLSSPISPLAYPSRRKMMSRSSLPGVVTKAHMVPDSVKRFRKCVVGAAATEVGRVHIA